MADLISFSGSQFEFNGKFFTGDPARIVKDNVAREVGLLAAAGRRSVQMTIGANVGLGSTGFTAKSIEVYQKPRNSLYAKVRVKPELRRPGARSTARYPAKRIPYIVMAVLESGRRGGRQVNYVNWRGGRITSRTKWKHGERFRKPLFAFRRAATEMRRAAPAIRDRVTKGLE